MTKLQEYLIEMPSIGSKSSGDGLQKEDKSKLDKVGKQIAKELEVMFKKRN